MSYQGWKRTVQPHPSGGFYVAIEEANKVRDELAELKSIDINRADAIYVCQQKCLGFEQGYKDMKFERDEVLEVLVDVLNQACQSDDGKIDSMALSAYADGLRMLEKHKRFKIEKQYGRRVIGEFMGPAISGR